VIEIAGVKTSKPAFAKRYDGKLLREDMVQTVQGENPEELEEERARRADARSSGHGAASSPLRHGGNIPVYRPGYEKQIGMRLYERQLKEDEDEDARGKGLDPAQVCGGHGASCASGCTEPVSVLSLSIRLCQERQRRHALHKPSGGRAPDFFSQRYGKTPEGRRMLHERYGYYADEGWNKVGLDPPLSVAVCEPALLVVSPCVLPLPCPEKYAHHVGSGGSRARRSPHSSSLPLCFIGYNFLRGALVRCP